VIAACGSCGMLGRYGQTHNTTSHGDVHFSRAIEAKAVCGQFTQYPHELPDGVDVEHLSAMIPTALAILEGQMETDGSISAGGTNTNVLSCFVLFCL
jgi:hypothetical protein